MKVWVLSHGCLYEGGTIDGVYKTEESGLKGVKEFMAKAKKLAITISKDEDTKHKVSFKKQKIGDGHHFWHEINTYITGSDRVQYEHDYVSLLWYELQ